MTDSFDRKARGGATPEEIAKLKALTPRPMEDRKELSDIPGWAQAALVYKFLYDATFQEALDAVKVKRSPQTLQKWRLTPAARKLEATIERFRENPVDMASAFLRANAMGVMVDRIVFLEMAKASGNFVEADKIARDLQDRIPELAKKSAAKSGSGSMTIQVNLPGGAKLDPIMIESSHMLPGETDDADYEIEPSDG